MDAHLTCASTLRCALCTVMAYAYSAAAAAGMTDPTLPPAPAQAPTQAPSASGAASSTPEPLRLQMILRGPGELLSALIDGRVVQIGDTLNTQGEGSARVLRISASAVVLRRADGSTQTLELAPEAAIAVSLTRTPAHRALENKR